MSYEDTNMKYAVMKRDEYDHLLDAIDEAGLDITPRTLDEATFFVIRKGDILGFATLRSYVDNALTLFELAKEGRLQLTDKEKAKLEALADMGAGMADDWQNSGHKIPD